jgi:hypothetical protein
MGSVHKTKAQCVTGNSSKDREGVDHQDWLVGLYIISEEGKMWYWLIFTHMINIAVVNVCIISLVQGKKSLDLLAGGML